MSSIVKVMELEADTTRELVVPSVLHGANVSKDADVCVPPRNIALRDIFIYHIKAGRKTIEGRCGSPKFSEIKENDVVRFFSEENPATDVVCRIERIARYSTFRQMLMAESVARCIPDAATIEDGLALYMSIPEYPEKEKMFGVVAFHLAVL